MRALLLTLTTCLFILPAQAKYSGGTGEPNDPYQIATAADLIALGNEPNDYGKHFILTADIDMDPNLPGRKVFDKAVIAPDTDSTQPSYGGTSFTGVFDGQGHAIANLTINGKHYLGLFGRLGRPDVPVGEIKSLGVVDVDIVGTGVCVGGLAGWNERGVLTQCYSSGVVSGTGSVGGLVGSSSGPIATSYSAGFVTGTGYVGGLVGCEAGDPGGGAPDFDYVTGCFWNVQTSGQTKSAGGIGKTTSEMKDPNTFMAAGWDFVGKPDGPHDIWAEPEGGGYPILWWQLSPLPSLPRFSGGSGEFNDPYAISKADELNSIGHNPRLMKCHFSLVNDLDLARFHFYPIGGPGFPYAGVFDGHAHTISHLHTISYLPIRGESLLGLFGQLGWGAQVRNVGVVDVNLAGSGGCVGGLVGYNNMGNIVASYSSGSVSGTEDVGGLVGRNSGGTIAASWSAGSVSGTAGSVGGLVGYNWHGSIALSCSTASVRGTNHVGGLVAFNSGSITTSYSVGAVSGWNDVGGLVGYNQDGSIVTSFWDTQTSGETNSAGGVGKTTAEMQTASTFLDAGWDFVGEMANGTEDIWWIDEGKDYPRLWWEEGDEASP